MYRQRAGKRGLTSPALPRSTLCFAVRSLAAARPAAAASPPAPTPTHCPTAAYTRCHAARRFYSIHPRHPPLALHLPLHAASSRPDSWRLGSLSHSGGWWSSRRQRHGWLPSPAVAVAASARFSSAADNDKQGGNSNQSSSQPIAAPITASSASAAGTTATPVAGSEADPSALSAASSQLAAAEAQLLASALAPSVPSAAPRPTASPPPLHSDSSPPPPAAYLSVPFAPMPAAAASSLPTPPDPLEAFASQQSDQPTVDSTKDPSAPLSIPAMPDLPPTQPTAHVPVHTNTATTADSDDTTNYAAQSAERADREEALSPVTPPHLSTADTPSSGAQLTPAPSSASPSSTHISFAASPTSSRASVSSASSHSAQRDVASAAPDVPQSPSAASVSGSSADVSSAVQTAVPSFLRPAELSLWSRIKLHPLFKHWPNIGYLISAVSVLVSDILWLRSLLICANCFGILVNRSFNFWTGIYWNIFFILANLLQIVLILVDRRQVQLSEDEQRVYDLVFADVFSPQEFRKLTKAGHMEDKPAGAQLMTQGREIELVYLIVDGLVVVEEERRVAVHNSLSDARSASGVASAVSGLVSSSSPSLLSYVFGSAGDDRAHGLMSDHSGHASTVTSAAPNISLAASSPQQALATTSELSQSGQLSALAGRSERDAVEAQSPGSPSSLIQSATTSDGGLVAAVREAAQRGVQALDQLTGLHQPAQHVTSLPETNEAEQQHQYQQQHAIHHLHMPPPVDATLHLHALPTQLAESAVGVLTDATPAVSSPPPPTPSPLTPALTPLILSDSLVDPSSGSASGSGESAAASRAERERRRQDRRAKKEKKRREKQFGGVEGQLGSSGLPSTLVSVSADGSYEVRRETIGYMRSGRLVGEMSLLAASAPTATEKARGSDDTTASGTTHQANALDVVDAPRSPSSATAPAAPSASASSSQLLLSSLPSPSALLSPTSIASSSSSVASASVTCVEACRVLVWRRDALRSLFFRFPSLSVGWYATVSSDLIARLSEARHLSLHNGYKLLLLGICAEGSVTRKQRTAADEYRRLNGISEDDHRRTLAELGWTHSEWDKGTKRQSWMDAIRAGLPTARRASV